MSIKTIIAASFIVVFIYFLWSVFKKDTYIGFYYPDPNNLTNYIESDELPSLQECRFWVEDVHDAYANGMNEYDYECGKNCKPNSSGLNVCEETLE